MADTQVRPSKADRTRAKLRAAAIEAIADRGYHGTTTRDIASGAGLSTAALYVYYASKEELLYAIAKDGHDDTLAIVRAAQSSSDRPTEQLASFVAAFVAYHAREHTSAIIINRELAALDAEHRTEIGSFRDEIESTLEGMLRAGVHAGDFDIADTRMTLIALLSLGLDVARWYRDGGEWTPDDVARYYTELALRMVGARRDQ